MSTLPLSKIPSPASCPSSWWKQKHIPENRIQTESNYGVATHCDFRASLLEQASLIFNTQKKLYRALVNVMRGADAQITPHHRFLFHIHHQDTILLHIHRTYLSPSIMPQGELNSRFLNIHLKAQYRMLPYPKMLWNFLQLHFIAKICRRRPRKKIWHADGKYLPLHQMLSDCTLLLPAWRGLYLHWNRSSFLDQPGTR